MSFKNVGKGQEFWDGLIEQLNYYELSEDLTAAGTDLAGAVAADMRKYITRGTTATGKSGISLGDGRWVGQQKIVVFAVEGNTVDQIVYYNNAAGEAATLTLAAAKDYGWFMWNGTGWELINNLGGTVG